MIEDTTVKLTVEDTVNTSSAKEMEVIEDDAFNYKGFQVVRGEFFAHISEPSFTFNGNKVSVNTACIKKLPDTEFVQILVNPNKKKLAVRPCGENEKDSFRWCTANSKKRSPKQITCRVFFAKIISLMEWNQNCRYKLLGKLIRSSGELLFIFDLTTPEIFMKTVKKDGKLKFSRTPAYPEDWKNQFGVPMEEHQKALQINIFDGYAVFGIQDGKTAQKQQNDSVSQESEVKEYEQANFFSTGSID